MNNQPIASIKALSAAAAIIFAVGLHPARANAQAGGCSERSTDRAGRVLRGKMEILIYALTAPYAPRTHRECVVPEPAVFQPFDLQALSNSADNKPSRSSSRREAYVPHIAAGRSYRSLVSALHQRK